MTWRVSRSPYLWSLRPKADDLFIVANSFEPRCLFATETAVRSSYRAGNAILIEYDSTRPEHAKAKSVHREQLEKKLSAISEHSQCVPTLKYDVIRFWEDLDARLPTTRNINTITIDISTFTKCTLVTLLTLLRSRFPGAQVRCVWTPGVYGNSPRLTRGVSRIFAVPGFGGIGWQECRVLILFLGQEADRSYALWRAVDPDRVYLIAAESEYTRISGRELLESTVFRAYCDVKEYVISAVDPRETEELLARVNEDLKSDGYRGDVAVGCFGTKLETLGIWRFLDSMREKSVLGWSYVYAVPRAFSGDRYTESYFRELCEATTTL